MKLVYKRIRTIQEHSYIINDGPDRVIAVQDYITEDGNHIESTISVNGEYCTNSRLIAKIDKFLTENS